MLDRLTKALDGDKVAKFGWTGLRDPIYLRGLAEQPLDGVIIDMQHGFADVKDAVEGVMAISAVGKSPVVRIPVGEWGLVERVLDFGALGVIAPMINTAQDAERFAMAAKYPTLGARSFYPRHAAPLYGAKVEDYLRQANEQTLALAMIETRQAYENLDEILAVEGIDGIFMGPSDFSISMTGSIIPDSYGTGTINEIIDIAKRARAANKIAGAFTLDVQQSNTAIKAGYQLISVGLDATYIQAGIAAQLDGLEG